MKYAIRIAILSCGLSTLSAQAQSQSPHSAETQPPVQRISQGTTRLDRLSELLEQRTMMLDEASETYGPDSIQMRVLRAKRDLVAKRIEDLALENEYIANNEAQMAAREIDIYYAEMKARTHRVDVSPEGLSATIRTLDQERETLSLDLASGKAKREALTKMLSEESARAWEEVKADPANAALAALVAIRQKQLEMVMKMGKEGVSTDAEVLKARAALAEAQLNASGGQKETMTTSTSVETTTMLKRELLEAVVLEQEREARLASVTARLHELEDAPQLLEQLPAAQAHLQAAKLRLREVREQKEEARYEIQSLTDHAATTSPSTQP